MNYRRLNLSLEEKAAQVLNSFRFGKKEISDYCLSKGWGGLQLSIWDHRSMKESRAMIEEFRNKSKIPPFITTDTESGLGATVPDATNFTNLLGIGATGDISLAAEIAKATALECAAIGLSWSFCPVSDVNTYDFNPSTNIRCYGTDAQKVSGFVEAHIKAYQENGLIATAKHFPGQGHSKRNSHYKLENIERSAEEMEKCELVPFQRAIACGVETIMTNHAIYPAFDSKKPATLSYEIVTKLLREKMKFNGIVITDCLQMLAIKEEYSVEDAVVLSLQAGCDIVLTENDYEKSLWAVVNAVKKGDITEKMLDEKVSKVIALKERYGLFKPLRKPDYSSEEHIKLAIEAAEKSVKVRKNDINLLPLKLSTQDNLLIIDPENKKRLDVGVHVKEHRLSDAISGLHGNITEKIISTEAIDEEAEKTLLDLCRKAKVVIYNASFRSSSGQLGILTEAQLEFLKKIKKLNPSLILLAINPFIISQIPFIDTVIFAYSKNKYVLERVGNLLFR